MKLSKLRALCDKAIEKYGDMEVGAYDKDYAYDVDSASDINSIKLRILTGAGSLPGESLDEDENDSSGSPVSQFACIFYEA
jgi:hypothetical protein